MMMVTFDICILCVLSLWVVPLLSIQVKYPEINFWNSVQSFETYYEKCAIPVTCDKNSKYRTISGVCNNLDNSLWGSCETPYVRLTPANYDDGDHKIRLQSDNSPLPGPRELQLVLFLPKASDAFDIRNIHMCQVSQWLAHDMTVMFPDISGPTDCCAIQNTENIPPQCQAVINIPVDDPVYSTINKMCLSFRRAKTSTLNFNCSISPQIPMNEASSFIDLSHFYGQNEDIAKSLRTFVDGKLKTEMINGQEFFVQEQRNGSLFCDGRDNVTVCFDGGDARHNQNLGLVLYQQIFIRFHHDVSISLKILNPCWLDEKLYQETRRLLIAVNQIALFRDFVPHLLGRKYSEDIGLTLLKDVKTVYDSSIMPQMALEFTVGGYRTLHSNIPSKYYFLNQFGDIVDQVNLNEFMSLPNPVIYDDNFEKILRGISNTPGRCPMASYNELISSFMFHKWIPGLDDMDLLSFDIQRSRDVGLSPYPHARKICGFSEIASFDDLLDVLSFDDVGKLKTMYASVYDVDLIVGLILEPILPDAMVGETARCIISDALLRVRSGDRYFCDVQGQPGSFTPDQFDVMWNLDYTKIFCATSKIDKLPKDIFKPYGLSEPYECKPLDLDLQAWKEDCNQS